MKKLLCITLATIVCVAFFLRSPAINAQSKAYRSIVGTDISSFSSQTLQGTPIDGSILKDYSLTFINLWATWCPPALEELVYFQQLSDYNANINVIGLLLEDATSTAEAALSYLASNDLVFTNIVIDSVLGEVIEQSMYVPLTLIVDSDGIIVHYYPGVFGSYDVLWSLAEQWLAVYPPEVYTVRFIDGITEAVLDVQLVSHGMDAQPPVPIEHEGYFFLGWIGEYQSITSDCDIVSQYLHSSEVMLGDINNNGTLDTADALSILRMAMGVFSGTPFMVFAADYNQNAVVDTADAIAVLRKAIGMV